MRNLLIYFTIFFAVDAALNVAVLKTINQVKQNRAPAIVSQSPSIVLPCPKPKPVKCPKCPVCECHEVHKGHMQLMELPRCKP